MAYSFFLLYTVPAMKEKAVSVEKKHRFTLASLAIKLPVYLALFCLILSVANGLIGYRVFKELYERQYRTVTEQFAETAVSYIDTDRIVEYAATGIADDAWRESDRMLETLTDTASIAYIYVTIPDENYESRVYIYDTINEIGRAHV